MRLKLFAISTSLFLALGAFSASAGTSTVNGPLVANNTVISAGFFSDTAGALFSATWDSVTSPYDLNSVIGAFGAVLQDSFGHEVANLYFSANTPFSGASTSVSGLVVGGNYSLKAYALGLQSYQVNNFTATVSNVAAVPGPVAGAGIPALAGLIGLVAWTRRKRLSRQTGIGFCAVAL